MQVYMTVHIRWSDWQFLAINSNSLYIMLIYNEQITKKYQYLLPFTAFDLIFYEGYVKIIKYRLCKMITLH